MVVKDASNPMALEKTFETDHGQGCFIGNADEVSDVDGYVLIPSKGPQKIAGGRVMNYEQIREIVDLLKVLTPDGRLLQGFYMPLSPQENKELGGMTVVCIGLKNLAQVLSDVDDNGIARSLREYDLLIATSTSKLGGEVARSIEGGYLLVFDKQKAALLCAEQIHRSVDFTLKQKIAIDSGDVWRVMRAHGIDYCGNTVTRCRELLKKTKNGEVTMTDSFPDPLPLPQPNKIVKNNRIFTFNKKRIPLWTLR